MKNPLNTVLVLGFLAMRNSAEQRKLCTRALCERRAFAAACHAASAGFYDLAIKACAAVVRASRPAEPPPVYPPPPADTKGMN